MFLAKPVNLACAALVALMCTTTAVRAGDVIRVPADAATIQTAIDAANPFDVVLITPGTYHESLVLLNKGISLVADGGVVSVRTLVIRFVPAGQVAVVDGMHCTSPQAAPGVNPGVMARDNLGSLRFSRCDFQGDGGSSGNWQAGLPPYDGVAGARVVNSASTSFVDCRFFGGYGAWLDDEDYEALATGGGPGLEVSNASVIAFDCEMYGADGGTITDTVTYPGGSGGSGVVTREGGRAQIHGCLLSGGGGGSADCDLFFGTCGSGGPGGSGVTQFDDDSHVVTRDCSYSPGTGGANGGPGFASDGIALKIYAGTSTTDPAPHRSLTANTAVREGDNVVLEIEGETGDTVLLFASVLGGYAPLPGRQGVWLLGSPLFVSGLGVGVVPGSGGFSVPIAIPELGPGIDGGDIHVQAVFDDGSHAVLGPAIVATLLDSSF